MPVSFDFQAHPPVQFALLRWLPNTFKNIEDGAVDTLAMSCCQQTLLPLCWINIYNVVPALNQHRLNVPCFLFCDLHPLFGIHTRSRISNFEYTGNLSISNCGPLEVKVYYLPFVRVADRTLYLRGGVMIIKLKTTHTTSCCGALNDKHFSKKRAKGRLVSLLFFWNRPPRFKGAYPPL